MRRPFAATAVALTMAVTVAMTLPAAAAVQDPTTDKRVALAETLSDTALSIATRVLEGNGRPSDPEPTMALLDLRLAMPTLSADDRGRAASLLARPTDGAGDILGDGYTTPSQKKCSTLVCVHWVSTTSDKATMAWVNESLTQMNEVWKFEINKRGYRRPLPDGSKGGNSKLDVYLKDVGSLGYYGYCAAEKPNKRFRFTYSGYCVLDNDFDPAQFGGAVALDSLKVTAAHEFFHAVQYAYDATEDRWFMESTATWMEERFADAINDNRQYLPYGQLGSPQTALDTYMVGGLMPYGNWAWWEYLSQRMGNGIVQQVWNKAGAFKGAPDKYSTQALVLVLKNKGGFKKNFGSYASGNTAPGKTYSEGSEWLVAAPTIKDYTLTSTAKSSGNKSTKVNHMASKSVKATSGAGLAAPGWSLRVTVDGPKSVSSPVVVVRTKMKDGSTKQQMLKLNKAGVGSGVYGFNATNVTSITVTLANASTRFKCWRTRPTPYSCLGRPLDNKLTFNYKLTAFKRP
jgi:hypothetical protein